MATKTAFVMNTLAVEGRASGPETDRIVAFTAPGTYAPRLRRLIEQEGWKPLWCPTIDVKPTARTLSSLRRRLSANLQDFSAVAFTSRTGIEAFKAALAGIGVPPLDPEGGIVTIAALGRDSELLEEDFGAKICRNPGRVRMMAPRISTPKTLAESLGRGRGRRVLCPVPLVIGVEEPPVVPGFLRELTEGGWVAERAEAYETRWRGDGCAGDFVHAPAGLDAIVFTSTAEAEGLLKSLSCFGILDWGMLRRRFPKLVVAAHGPVTAVGAERLGVSVDVVSSSFASFTGVIHALARRWGIATSHLVT